MILLITGGSGSGKSAFAESAVLELGEGRRIYIATMYPYDQESKLRVKRHQLMRAGKGFETIERYTDLKNLTLPSDSVVLLECMSNLVANEMFQEDGAHEHTVEQVIDGIRSVSSGVKHLVIVTNEIFSGADTYQGDTRLYQKYLGEINQKIGEMADQVVEVVYGIPIWQKGGRRDHEAVE